MATYIRKRALLVLPVGRLAALFSGATVIDKEAVIVAYPDHSKPEQVAEITRAATGHQEANDHERH